MAVNNPKGVNARKQAVRKRSQGEPHWMMRSRKSGQFMDQKKDPRAKPFTGVRKEKKR